jgi:hypothetical protein
MERVIHGPDNEHLTAGECAAWLGVSLTTFKGLADFPPPLRFRGAARWGWFDVVAYAWLKARAAGGGPAGRP